MFNTKTLGALIAISGAFGTQNPAMDLTAQMAPPLSFGYRNQGNMRLRLAGKPGNPGDKLRKQFARAQTTTMNHGKSKFQGFRKVRKFVPELGMSVWVKVEA